MRKSLPLLIIFIFLITVNLAFASIEIYCPHCKTRLYTYIHDKVIIGSVIKARDFLPANDTIKQPQEADPMVCPLCGCPLNLYESWAWERKVSKPVFNCWAISFLTKDKDGNWIGIPYDVKVEDWEGKH